MAEKEDSRKVNIDDGDAIFVASLDSFLRAFDIPEERFEEVKNMVMKGEMIYYGFVDNEGEAYMVLERRPKDRYQDVDVM